MGTGKENQRRRQQNAAGAGGSGGASTTKFTAPTSGLEYVYFTWGTANDAAKFEDTVNHLARHVDTSLWPQPLVHGQDEQQDKNGYQQPGRRKYVLLSWKNGSTT